MSSKTVYTALIVSILLIVVLGSQQLQTPSKPEIEDNLNSTVVAENLDVPWDIEFLPNGDMLVTERSGTLLKIETENGSATEYMIEGVEHRGEGGLLGLALDPGYEENNRIYLYMTTEKDEMLQNRVVRYTLEDRELSNPQIIIEDLPGAQYHDGGRIAFGPDKKLYITAGDATKPGWAQNTGLLAGKILRINANGSIPDDNPFGNEVYSYGHRNTQGLTWVNGELWATEHGRSGIQSGMDELNKIQRGGNYGWPEIEGDQIQKGMIQPVIHSGARVTWAPAAATSIDNHIYFTGLRGNGLYHVELEDGNVANFTKHLTSYGRLREVELGPDSFLYITTSNTDGRGTPVENDDRVIKVNSTILEK